MYVVIRREAFATLEARANYSNEITKFTVLSDVTGVVVTPDFTLDYYYDMGAEKLHLNIGKRSSLAARIANETASCSFLMDLFHNLGPVPEAAPEVPKPVLKPQGAK